jgi:hypothetical protein
MNTDLIKVKFLADKGYCRAGEVHMHPASTVEHLVALGVVEIVADDKPAKVKSEEK